MFRLTRRLHTLQLVLKEIDKNDAYRHLVQKCRGIVKCHLNVIQSNGKLIREMWKDIIVDCTT